jgi:hypothetical protein
MTPSRLFACLLALLPLTVAAQGSFISTWQARATRAIRTAALDDTLATVTPRLEQEFRTDFVRETTPTLTTTWIYAVIFILEEM